jgi:hypothetical protein
VLIFVCLFRVVSLQDLHRAYLKGLDELFALADKPGVNLGFSLEHGAVNGDELDPGFQQLRRLLKSFVDSRRNGLSFGATGGKTLGIERGQ